MIKLPSLSSLSLQLDNVGYLKYVEQIRELADALADTDILDFMHTAHLAGQHFDITRELIEEWQKDLIAFSVRYKQGPAVKKICDFYAEFYGALLS